MNDFNKLANMILNTKNTSVRWHTNCSCLKCNRCEESMVRVGALIFCFGCYTIFKTEDPVREERELYLKWLKVYREKCDEQH